MNNALNQLQPYPFEKLRALLGSVTPEGLTRIQLFSGGAEAVEAAFRLAKSVTKNFEFVGFSGAFHGKTGGVLPLLWGDFKDGLGPFVPGTYVAPYAYCYRCPLKLTHPDCGMACVEETRSVIRNQSGGRVAAIIVEPMQGTAGNVIPPPGFIAAVRGLAKEIGALTAVLGGIDGLVFTAGIGENSAEIRRRVVDASAWLGIELDDDANARRGPRISREGSRVSAWVIPTNEELMIARHTGMLLGLIEEACLVLCALL